MRTRIGAGAALLTCLFASSGHIALAAPPQVIFDSFPPSAGNPYNRNLGGAIVGGDGVSNLLVGEVQFASGTAGDEIQNFLIDLANLNPGTETARPTFEFWVADGAGGAPGTMLAQFTGAPITLNSDTTSFYTFITPDLFAVPVGEKIWAGVVWDNDFGTTGATAAEAGDFAVVFGSTPSVGSSTDQWARSQSSGFNYQDNPVLSGVATNPDPYMWSFSASAPSAVTPEGGTLPLICSGILGCVLGGGKLLRRRKR